MARQNLRTDIGPALDAELPQLNLAVAPARHEAPCIAADVSARRDDLSRRVRRGPAHAVDARAARLEDLVGPSVVLELEDGDVAVGGGAGEEAAGLVRGPCYEVDRGGVQGDVVDFLPCAVLLAPDEDLAVVGGGCEDVAVLGVGPGDAPDGAFVSVGTRQSDGRQGRCQRRGSDVPLERLDEAMRLVFYLEYLDGLVGGAGGQPAAVVVEDSIVLHVVSIVGDEVDDTAAACRGGGKAQVGGVWEAAHDGGGRKRGREYAGRANWQRTIMSSWPAEFVITLAWKWWRRVSGRISEGAMCGGSYHVGLSAVV